MKTWLEATKSAVLITSPISGRLDSLEVVSLSVAESDPLVLKYKTSFSSFSSDEVIRRGFGDGRLWLFPLALRSRDDFGFL